MTEKKLRKNEGEPFKSFQGQGQGHRNEHANIHIMHKAAVMPSVNIIVYILSEISASLKVVQFETQLRP